MEPRWLVTVNENLTVCKRIVRCKYSRFRNNIINTLQNLPVSVRIGQNVDVVGKAGNPKSIVGGHVQTTPVLLCTGEKAELVSDQYEPLSSVLEGFVILREKVISY